MKWFCSAIALVLLSSSQAYHVTPPSASIARGGRASHSLYSLKIRSASFFGIGATRRSLQLAPNKRLQLTSVPNGEQNTVESEVQPSISNSSDLSSRDISPTDVRSSSTSLLESIDKLGMKLKPLALAAHNRSIDIKSTNVNGSSSQGSSFKSLLYSVQSNMLWMLYIIYRGYRGFFVILPAVFKEAFRQLEESNVAVDAFGDENGQDLSTASGQRPMRLRTRVTISVLSSILTLSYVISGAFRVLGKFMKTFTTTTSVESSLQAAADEVESNEDKLRRNKAS
ncbi:hypothetical protein ACHAWO_004631 [Cyclotella atomus]|uniref:Uncharacterized protein n=1 Tax=Cyclotella atomus TaxID=382360 RepID=A0ABD3NG83_9STRA